MFTVTDVPLAIRRLTLELDEDDEGDAQRYCKTVFRIVVFSRERAEAVVGMPVLRHCFGSDDLPLWDLDDVWFKPPTGKFVITLKSAPDIETASAVIEAATVETFRVWRPKDDRRDLMAEFVVKHTLDRADIKDLAEMITVWEAGHAYATFTEIRAPLLEQLDQPQPRLRHRQTH